MKHLTLSPDLKLPLDAVTQTFGILAKRRAGKSYLARKFAEQLHGANAQIVIVDPKGDWWGIRSAADGKAPGLAVVIIGGERADVPLEPNGGEVIAKLVVEEQVSALLDLSLLRKNQVSTFMTGFLETLYRLKAHEKNRTPMMLIIDEADAIAPQKPFSGDERMLGATEDIVRRGGQRGIGCALVSQRSAVLNKNVLTQVQILITLRTIAPQDLKAMDDWINVHGTAAQRKTLMESLPSLPIGDAWVWSPGWPTDAGIFRRIHTAPIQTFDSGATPKHGEQRREPKAVADIDLDAVRRQMAATIERAKENDPRELRAEVARLRAELAKKPAAAAPTVERVEVQIITDKQIARLEKVLTKMQEEAARHGQAMGKIWMDNGGLVAEILAGVNTVRLQPALNRADHGVGQAVEFRKEYRAMTPLPPPRTSVSSQKMREKIGSDSAITGPEQRVLDAIAWWVACTPDQSSWSRAQVAFAARYRPNTGNYNNVLGRLKTAGMIDYPAQGVITLTADGWKQANHPAAPGNHIELRAMVLSILKGPQHRVLAQVMDIYPKSMSREELAQASGYEPNTGNFNNILGQLRTLELIEYPQPGQVVARGILFP